MLKDVEMGIMMRENKYKKKVWWWVVGMKKGEIKKIKFGPKCNNGDEGILGFEISQDCTMITIITRIEWKLIL